MQCHCCVMLPFITLTYVLKDPILTIMMPNFQSHKTFSLIPKPVCAIQASIHILPSSLN